MWSKLFGRTKAGFTTHFERGRDLQRRGRFEDAAAEFGRALEHEERPAGFFGRAMALVRLGDLEGAIRDFERVANATAPMPMVRDATINLGRACRELRRHRESLAWFERAIQLDPRSSIALCGRAQARIQLALQTSDPNELERAITDLDEAVALDPSDPVLYWNRAIAYQQLSEERRAKEDVERFLDRAPPGHQHREEAERMLETETPASPELSRRRHTRFEDLLTGIVAKNDEDDHEGALEACEQALELIESDPGGKYEGGDAVFDEKATALWGLGRPEEALRSVERGLERYPETFRLWSTRGYLLLELGRPREALGAFQRYVAEAGRAKQAQAAKPLLVEMLDEQVAAAKRIMRQLRKELNG